MLDIIVILFSVPDAFPRNLTAINSGPQGVFLSWVPPPLNKHNGVITGYVVKIIGLRELVVDNTTSHSIGGLNASSSYSFSVAAKTSVGPGPFSEPVSLVTHHGGNAGKPFHQSLILYSSPLCTESPAPEGVSAERISATQIRVTWPAVEDNAANSPILSYVVKYYPVRSDPRSRREEPDFKLIQTDTNVTIGGLVPSLTYGVAVATNTEFGTGTFSDVITVGRKFVDSNLLNVKNFFCSVRVQPLSIVLYWSNRLSAMDCKLSCICIRIVLQRKSPFPQLYHVDAKLKSMKDSLVPELEKSCQCQFSVDYLEVDQLQCISAHTDWLIVLGRIIGTNLTDSKDIRDKLQEWSDMESKAVIEGVHLTTLQFCSVPLEGEDLPYCETLTAVTDADKRSDASEGEPLSSNLTYSIVGVVVVMLMMIFAVLVCIGTVSLYRKKKVRDRQLQ